MSSIPTKKGKLQKIKGMFRSAKSGSSHLDKIIRQQLVCNMFSTARGVPLKRDSQLYSPANPWPKVKNYPWFAEKLRGVSITENDWKNVVRRNDGKDTFFYLDPPYEKSKD